MTHRIILLNFTEKEAQFIAKSGYNVERGFLGPHQGAHEYIGFQSPHPLYEYDILFYNSNVPADIESEFTRTHSLLADNGSFRALADFNHPPVIRVSFIGSSTGMGFLLHGGVGFMKLVTAEANVSSFKETEKGQTFAIEKIHELLTGFKGQIESVGQFFIPDKDHYPLYTFTVLRSRSGQPVAGYGTIYDSKVTPRYIILPQLKSNSKAVVQVLQCLEELVPELFPDKVKRDWLEADEFLLPEERSIQQEIKQKIAETIEVIETKKKELQRVAEENSFVKALLYATEDSSVPVDQRLSGMVRKALEFLEFEVVDIDQAIKSAIRKEDFWVIEGDYLAITEVTGTKHKNPKIKEFNDILGRMVTLYKRKGELVLPEGSIVSGLLVLNYDIDNHPAKRPSVYTGDDEHIVETALEQGIGLLSTVELHKIVVAVKEQQLSKVDARAALRKPGRIEFNPRPKKP